MVVNAFNPSVREAGAGGLRPQAQPVSHGKTASEDDELERERELVRLAVWPSGRRACLTHTKPRV